MDFRGFPLWIMFWRSRLGGGELGSGRIISDWVEDIAYWKCSPIGACGNPSMHRPMRVCPNYVARCFDGAQTDTHTQGNAFSQRPQTLTWQLSVKVFGDEHATTELRDQNTPISHVPVSWEIHQQNRWPAPGRTHIFDHIWCTFTHTLFVYYM